MQPRQHVPFAALSLAFCSAACFTAPPPAPPPPLPWLVEVASIDGEAGAGLSRCDGETCEQVAEHSVVGMCTLRADRGARVKLSLGASSELWFGNGTEVTLVNDAVRTVVVRKGLVELRRSNADEAAAVPMVVRLADRDVLANSAPLTLALKNSEKEGAAVMVRRGRAALANESSPKLFATGQGAVWASGEAPSPRSRWMMALENPATFEAPSTHSPRGLGTMTARVPGTTDVVSGVRLARHHVSAEVHSGFARTSIEEDFENETTRTLEGTFVFPLPPDASISRLALYVDDTLMEGEIVERKLAARTFRAIVDDTVRPRDPAILEQLSGSSVSLKIFPIPAKGKRRVVLEYDQALSEDGDRVRYVYPLSLGADRASTIDDFALTVSVKDPAASSGSTVTDGYAASISAEDQNIIASYSAKKFVPAADFTLAYTRRSAAAADLSWSAGPKNAPVSSDDKTPAGYFAVRLRAGDPQWAAAAPQSRPARAFVIDTSHSQSVETFDASVRVVKTALAGLDPDDQFVVLACDSACVSYPEDGLVYASDEALATASDWLAKRTAGGSSDLVGSLLAAAERVGSQERAQVVYLGDGVATSGELDTASILERVSTALRPLDTHFIGVGPSVDERALSLIASSVSGTYERFVTGESLQRRAEQVARTLDAPILRDARLVLPQGAFDVIPETLPPLRLGQQIRVFGRFRPDASTPETVPASFDPNAEQKNRGPLGEVRLSGNVNGAPVSLTRSLDWSRALEAPSSAVHAMWARARIAELEADETAASTKEVVRLSTVHHVLSRSTALLVLENEQMFIDTGIRSAIRRVLASEPQGPKSSGPVALLNPQASAPVSPWGSAPGDDALSARGNLWGDSFGSGGLGLTGVGEGGGGTGQGLGTIGTIGHGAGVGTGIGFGSGSGRLEGSHKTNPPRVRMGATSVSGRLPPEVVQRIVRRNFGRFRLCYENGLRSNPNLSGRVSVRFVIDRTGSATAVSNGGSDLPDQGVISCVVNAFRGLSFPEPEGGVVTVVYPIMFSPGEGGGGGGSWSSAPWTPPPASSSWSSSWRSWMPSEPTAVHRLPNEAPPQNDDAAIAKIVAQVADPQAPRSAHQALIKKLLAAGRFDDAFVAASRYRTLDPDHETALELHAQAAAATSRMSEALTSIDAQSESDSSSVVKHRRAAAALSSAGDERRACAHFRAVATLTPADDAAKYQALRCRARLGERASALTQARALPKPGPLVQNLITALQAGSAPPFEPTLTAGSFDVRVTCAAEEANCPAPVLVTPGGTVVSPWTPASPTTRSVVSTTRLVSGTYRTLLIGGVPSAGAEVTVTALGQSKTVKVITSSLAAVALVSTVTMPQTF
ncbi:MAG: AgmX/PglI C-terminal domain-containing protein [Polyangiaceae bacterium]|nr:AgmX/PglI C-terminal domain-containing protein [Polyangiaceae bacterium]